MKAISVKLAIALLAVFAPAKSIMLTAMVMILADLVTGIAAAVKRKERVTSAGLHRTMVKLVVYEVGLALGYIAQHYLLMDLIPVINILGSYIGLVELTSAYENIDAISGGNLLQGIIAKLKSKNDIDVPSKDQ